MGNTTEPQSNPPVPNVTEPLNPVGVQPTPTTSTYQSPNLAPPSPTDVMIGSPISQKKPSFMLPLVLSFVFLLFVILFGVGSYAVAYQKITLPEKYKGATYAITDLVQSLSFMPKTPDFLLPKALLAQEKIEKVTYDISLAIVSEDGTLLPELALPELAGGFDLAAKGGIDYSDTKNIRFTTNASLTKDFNVELLKPDHLLYFRINKIPSFLLSLAGLKAQIFDPVLNTWYSYDTTPLETEARAEIQKEDKEVPIDKFVQGSLENVIDEKLLTHMKITKDTVDNHAVYKIALTANEELIDHIGKKIEEERKKDRGASLDRSSTSTPKLSDIVKEIKWEVSIDQKQYYVRKVVVTAKIEVDDVYGYYSSLDLFGGGSDSPQKATVSFVAKFDNFGEEVIINNPANYQTWEEFNNTMSEIFNKQYEEKYPGKTSPISSAKDSKRVQDLMSLTRGLQAYKFDCQTYPLSLTDLTIVHTECNQNLSTMAGIPKDPDSSEYYYKVSTDLLSYSLCANLEVPNNDTLTPFEASKLPCPDPNYNYHLSSQY